MNNSVQTLFELIDQELESKAGEIRDRIFSEYRQVPFSSDQRKELQPLIRKELDSLVQGILGLFDNVGGTLPDDILGYIICSTQSKMDIRNNNLDYADLWVEYLLHKNINQDKM